MADFIQVTQQVPAKPQQRKLNWAKSTKSTFITNGSLMNFLWCSLHVSHDWTASSLAENTRTSSLRWMFYLIQLRTTPSTRLCHRYHFFFSVDVKNQSSKTYPSNTALRKNTKVFGFINAAVKVCKMLVGAAAGPVSCASVCSHPGLPVTWMIHASVIK